ncbi:MAG: TldD/PmbA family protein [Nanoarchaeota archaeon]
MDNFIRYAQKKGADYAEIHSIETKQTNIELQNKDTKELSFSNIKGFSARVLYKGAFGSAYSNKNEFKLLIDKAIKIAKVLSKENPNVRLKEFAPIKKKFSVKCKINPNDINIEDKKNNLLKFEILPKISMININYADFNKKYCFINSEGRDLELNDYMSGLFVWAYAKEGNKIENFLKPEREHCGYEIMERYGAVVNEAMVKAKELLRAEFAKGGEFPVIINQKLAGVFAHEAVGHACEADHIIKNNSVFVGKLNKKVASDKVTIADDGSFIKWGYTPFDNEGVIGKRNILIENGILKGYLHSRETASLLNMEPTGNGRAMNLSSKAMPRMTNTIIERGDSSFDEMLKEIKHGYYLKGSMGGEVNPITGEFLFNAQEGFLIENGRISKRVKTASLIGNILDILQKISLVAKDLGGGSGYCGKDNQFVPVSENAPHIKIDLAKVGGKGDK